MKNKWLIALAAVGIHMSIGSVYAFSVLTRPLMAEFGFTLAETTWTFSLAILFLGLSAAVQVGHVDVGKDQVDRFPCQQVECFKRTVAGLDQFQERNFLYISCQLYECQGLVVNSYASYHNCMGIIRSTRY